MKKLFSFMIVAILVITCMVPAAFAADTARISVNTVTSHSGEQVTVSVSTSSATFATYLMRLTYDSSKLELLSFTKGAATQGDFAGNKDNGMVTAVSATDYTANGVLFTATFQVSASAVPGETYDVGVVVSNITNTSLETLTVPTPASGGVTIICSHNWSAWSQTTDPDCEHAGEETRTCSICHETETRPVSALGHNYVLQSDTATCGQNGVKTYKCSRCGDTYTEVSNATGNHSWGTWTVTTPATCTESGVKTRTCTVCGATDTQTQSIPATGHSWGAWTVTRESTCAVAGEKTRTCSACGETETAAIEKLAHTPVWAHDNRNHWHECSVCGEIIDSPAAHSLEWIVDRRPTNTETGLKHQECECGFKTNMNTVIPIDAERDDVPETSDITSQIILGAVVIFGVLASVACAVVTFKRKATR